MENIPFKIWDGNPIVIRAQGLKREAHARTRPRKPISLFSKTYRYLRNAVGGRVGPQFPASLCDGAHQAPFVIWEPSRRTEATPPGQRRTPPRQFAGRSGRIQRKDWRWAMKSV